MGAGRTTLVKEMTGMYVERDIEARSCNHHCSGKAICIKYSESVFVALCIQHAMRMRHIVMCGLPGLQARYSRKYI
jgi:sulfur transfer complex TusBCD TusB component (DsrH family)